jgi:hypothetical protein
VPATSPTTARKAINKFFVTIKALGSPLVVFQYVDVSMRAGNANPNADRQRAPNREMNNSRFGIATASRTINE